MKEKKEIPEIIYIIDETYRGERTLKEIIEKRVVEEMKEKGSQSNGRKD